MSRFEIDQDNCFINVARLSNRYPPVALNFNQIFASFVRMRNDYVTMNILASPARNGSSTATQHERIKSPFVGVQSK